MMFFIGIAACQQMIFLRFIHLWLPLDSDCYIASGMTSSDASRAVPITHAYETITDGIIIDAATAETR